MCSYEPAGSWTRLNHAKYLSEFAIADVTTSAIVVSRKRPLIEINHYGERLIGCIECNVWVRPGDDTMPMPSPSFGKARVTAPSSQGPVETQRSGSPAPRYSR